MQQNGLQLGIQTLQRRVSSTASPLSYRHSRIVHVSSFHSLSEHRSKKMWTSKIAVVSAFLAILSVTEAISVKRENSLAPPYTDEAETMLFWDLIGSAQLAGDYIRLTTDEQEKQGGIWNNFPIIANNWEFQSHFHIHGKGVNLMGDGMAFWYVQDTLHQGPVFGSKDYFSGLGVFIDTFENQREHHKYRHPYISAMVNNGSLHYEGAEDGSMTLIGGCHVPIRNLEVPTKIAISYIDEILAVYLDYEGFGQWKLCFKSLGVHLPTGSFFGITASTSDVSDNHDIISSTALNMDAQGKWKDKSDVIPEAENVIIPEKYYKDDSEEEEEGESVVEKREVKEDVAEEVQAEAEGEKYSETSETNAEEVAPPSISLLRKLIYVTGAGIMIFLAISTYRKYSERRRERMQKRLF